MSQGNYDKALPLYLQLIELQPDNYVGYYNMACLHAQQGHVEESLDWLRNAVQRGFNNWKFLQEDNDLSNIRDTAYFKELSGHNNSVEQNK